VLKGACGITALATSIEVFASFKKASTMRCTELDEVLSRLKFLKSEVA